MNQFYEEGHLGGCMVGGDPATHYPATWKYLLTTFPVKKVLDIGCGEGQALEFFLKNGVETVGIEGCHVAQEIAAQKTKVILHDLTQGSLTEEADFIWCCEFVEHIEAKYVHNFMQTVINSKAEYVVITHAFPGQGGYHHVNLQSPSYWINLFAQYGYELNLPTTRAIRTIAALENPPLDNHLARSGLVFKKKTDFESKRNAVLTWASGDNFCSDERFEVYLKTASKLTDCDNYIFTHDMCLKHREKCAKHGFKIVDINPNEVEWVVRDRFLHWARFLSNHSSYYCVGLVDCKDVVFFEDVFKWIELFRCNDLKKELFFVGEGKKHHECEWNTKDQKNLQNKLSIFKSDYLDWEVICAGTIFGLPNAVTDLMMSIWSLTLQGFDYSDQAAINFLYQTKYQFDQKTILLLPTQHSFAATDLTTKSALKYFDKKLSNLDKNYAYTLWHQWDRTIYKNQVLKDYYDR